MTSDLTPDHEHQHSSMQSYSLMRVIWSFSKFKSKQRQMYNMGKSMTILSDIYMNSIYIYESLSELYKWHLTSHNYWNWAKLTHVGPMHSHGWCASTLPTRRWSPESLAPRHPTTMELSEWEDLLGWLGRWSCLLRSGNWAWSRCWVRRYLLLLVPPSVSSPHFFDSGPSVWHNFPSERAKRDRSEK